MSRADLFGASYGSGCRLARWFCRQALQRLEKTLGKVGISRRQEPNLGEFRGQERSDIGHLSAPSPLIYWSLESAKSPEEALGPA